MTSTRIRQVQAAMAPFSRFLAASPWLNRPREADASDFVFGTPHEPPLPGFVAALKEWAEPRSHDWFGYKLNEPGPREHIARALTERRGVPFDPDAILLTNGAFASLAVALCALLEPGDEVIFVSPPWFFYEAHIVAYGGTAVRVKADPNGYDLDVAAIADAISGRTRAIIVNSPNNPTGKIYPPPTLERLAGVLSDASARNGRPIVLLSDEAYSRVLFDGNDYPSPTAYYPHALLLYTYGKTLLTPGQRLGYIALPPGLPDRDTLRDALFAAQMVTGFAFPNALLQHALGDLEALSLDLAALQRKRDRLVAALRAMGYQLHVPEGTFYLLVRAPVLDDRAFCALLARHKVYVLPGDVVELPGTFRISLTASDAMIERALPAFRAALEEIGVAGA